MNHREVVGRVEYSVWERSTDSVVASGVREVWPEDIVEEAGRDSKSTRWISLNSEFSLSLCDSFGGQKSGFALMGAKTGEKMFSWEWFDPEDSMTFVKRQEAGRLKVAFENTPQEQIWWIGFDEDVSIRLMKFGLSLTMMRPRYRIRIAAGSWIAWGGAKRPWCRQEPAPCSPEILRSATVPWESAEWKGTLEMTLTKPEAGWTLMELATNVFGQRFTIQCSGCFSPFEDMVEWLTKVNEGQLPASFEIDEEGTSQKLEALPTSDPEVVEFRVTEVCGPEVMRCRLDRRQLVASFASGFDRWLREKYDHKEWWIMGELDWNDEEWTEETMEESYPDLRKTDLSGLLGGSAGS
jgi:hypothetical protein